MESLNLLLGFFNKTRKSKHLLYVSVCSSFTFVAIMVAFMVSQPVRADVLSETYEVPLLLSNECAIFYDVEETTDGNILTTLRYGERILFINKVTVKTVLNISDSGNVNFKFNANSHGSGDGFESGIKYQFNMNTMLKVNTSLDDHDPFTGTFNVKARILGQGQDINGDGSLTGASNNAILNFKIRVHYANGNTTTEAFDWSIECAGSPWANLMEKKDVATGEPVGRGFGDVWNKYAWSAADYDGGLFIATKNGYYNIEALLAPSAPVQACIDAGGPIGTALDVFRVLGCVEIAGDDTERDSRGAEIWRFDYKKKRWTRVYDAPKGVDAPQGFRDMVVHNGKLYVAADLGAFVSGVSYVSGVPGTPHFPGVALLVTDDGFNFDEIPCPDGFGDLCATDDGLPALNNTSIRALASYNGLLYIGTFNFTGVGQIWSYDDSSGIFTKVWETAPGVLIAELEPYKGLLYVGAGGAIQTQGGPGPGLGTNDYMYVYNGSGVPTALPGLPDIDPEGPAILKLFVGLDKLWAGTANYTNGFSLLTFDGAVWEIIVDGPDNGGGFFNSTNAYLWSMADANGRLVIGTFNFNIIDQLPRGQSELWYSDDGVNWTEHWLPLDWGINNYGIRNMVFANKKLFLGTASIIVAPDEWHPGTEVWTISESRLKKGGRGKKGK